MKDNISPEEKLLRLIRGQKKQSVTTDKQVGITPAVSEVKSTIKPSIYLLIKKYSSLIGIHKIIWIFFVTSCIYLAVSLIYPLVWLKRIKLPQIAAGRTIESKIEPKVEVKPYEFYQEGIANKQIFGARFSQDVEKPTAVGLDFMKDINLVGIIAGENPQAIIEDKKAQKTYYLSKGQFMGEFQLEGIGEGKIILNYNGQRYELYL